MAAATINPYNIQPGPGYTVEKLWNVINTVEEEQDVVRVPIPMCLFCLFVWFGLFCIVLFDLMLDACLCDSVG